MRTKRYLLLFGLAFLFVAVFNLPQSLSRLLKAAAREAVIPYQDLSRTSVRRGGRLVAAFRNIDRVLDENERLRASLAQARAQSQRDRELARENDELRAMLAYERRSPYSLIAAEVVGRGDVSGWWQTAQINKGQADGITTNMAVITAEGLVGKTISVSPHGADVLLITDPGFKVGCRVKRVNALGILRGGGFSRRGRTSVEMLCPPEPARMDYISKESDLLTGDEVLTSGLGGVFPKDLTVGRIVEVGMAPGGLYRWADVMPAADLSALTRVFVVRQ